MEELQKLYAFIFESSHVVQTLLAIGLLYMWKLHSNCQTKYQTLEDRVWQLTLIISPRGNQNGSQQESSAHP